MKRGQVLTAFLFLLFCGFWSCSEDDPLTSSTEVRIVNEFPKLYLSVENSIIRTQEEFGRIIPAEEMNKYKEQYDAGPQEGYPESIYEDIKRIYEGLTGIDFSKETLIIGKESVFPYQAEFLKQQFTHIEKVLYKFTLYVTGGDMPATDTFNYAIVVENFPEDGRVEFEVIEGTQIFE